MTQLFSGDALASFAALTFLEVVLGVDNVVFIALAVNRLHPRDHRRGRTLGLALALVLRVVMLIGLVWVTRLQVGLFEAFGRTVTIKDVVLAGGGVFLIWKATTEILETISGKAAPARRSRRRSPKVIAVVLEIGFINIVFSVDSIVTAIGMTNDLAVMIAAVVVSSILMLFAAEAAGVLIQRRPTTKLLALAFILLVGGALVAEGAGFNFPRGYIYAVIVFSLFVEALNAAYQRARRRQTPPAKGPRKPGASAATD